MESRKAEHLTWPIKEAITALLEDARRRGVVLPPTFDGANLQVIGEAMNADGTKGVVQLTIIAPLGWKGGLSVVPKNEPDA